MNTLLNYLTVLAVAALLAGPALYGVLHERRIDRQLRAARQRTRVEVVRAGRRSAQARPGTARVALRHAPCE
ncbi:hypothetical protein [Streptomyces sp. NPDC002054]|uniref:hypothetical protein n=1 Tax=Streptomyces sp. NPDC002054 TaxID=3154663 RepID=UPI00331A16C1